jgi:uncharacterized membrane protein
MIVILSIVTIALVVALVLAINALYPPAGQGDRKPAAPDQTPAAQPPSAAEAELELRYARGEIDAETLARQRAVLRQRPW